MIKCVVCECASVLYYEPPGQRPPVTCPECGRDTRRYISMRQDDPRVQRLVETYKNRFIQKNGERQETGEQKPVGEASKPPVGKNVGEASGLPSQKPKTSTPKPDSGKQEALQKKGYVLVSGDGSYRIPVPEQGGVIGRTAIGAHELAHNGRVSRQHMRVVPAKRARGLLIEDMSSNGTFLDGRRLSPGHREFAVVGSEIRLSREVLILREEERNG